MYGHEGYDPSIVIACVIPSVRLQQLKEFLCAWSVPDSPSGYAWDKTILIIDHDKLTSDELIGLDAKNATIYTRQHIRDFLGDRAGCIATQNAGIRNFGYLKAYEASQRVDYEAADIYVLTLDDDCLPTEDCPPIRFIEKYVDAFRNFSIWQTESPGVVTRGLPYYSRGMGHSRIGVHVGLWSENIDLDAPHRLVRRVHPFQGPVGFSDTAVDRMQDMLLWHPRCYYPMCGMSMMFNVELAPLMYNPLMGPTLEVNRFDDIWSGLIVQRLSRELGYVLSSGPPIVRHTGLSDPMMSLVGEAVGIAANEHFWRLFEEWNPPKELRAFDRHIGLFTHLNNHLRTYVERIRGGHHQLSRVPNFADYLQRMTNGVDDWLSLFRPIPCEV